MGRYGHSEERSKVEPLFTMTTSQVFIKELYLILYTFLPKKSIWVKII